MYFAILVQSESGGNTLRLWDFDMDTGTGREQVLPAPVVSPTDMKIYPSGRFFFVATQTGIVVITLSGKSKQIINLPNTTAMALSKDGQLLAAAADSIIGVWQLPNTKIKKTAFLAEFKDHTGPVTALAFADDNTILSGSTDQLLYRWDALTGKEVQCYEGHSSEISCVSGTNGPSCLTGGGIRDGTVRLWNLDTGTEALRLQVDPGGVASLALATRMMLLATGTRSGRLMLWNLDRSSPKPFYEMGVLDGWINRIWFADDGKLLLAACTSGALYIIDNEAAPRLRVRLPPMGGPIVGLDVFSDFNAPDLNKGVKQVTNS